MAGRQFTAAGRDRSRVGGMPRVRDGRPRCVATSVSARGRRPPFKCVGHDARKGLVEDDQFVVDSR